MADTLRDLVVSLSLDPTNFARNLKTVNVLIKQAQSEFDLAGAGITRFENTLPGAQAKVEALAQKLNLQREALAQYEGILGNAQMRLENSLATQAKYTQKLADSNKELEEAKKFQEELKEVLEVTVFAFGEESEDAKAAAEALEEQNQVVKKLEKNHRKIAGQLANVNKQVQNNGDAVNRATTNLNNAKAAIRETEAELNEATAVADLFADMFYQASESIINAGTVVSDFGDKMASVGRKLNNYLTRPIKDFASESLDASMSFESAFTTVRQVTDATEDEYTKWAQTCVDMSEQVGVSAVEIAKTMAEAGRLGVANTNLATFTRSALDLGQAFNMSATDAATSMARFFNIMGTSYDSVTNFGSSVTYLANNYATTADEILEMAKGLAGTGKIIGMSEQDIIGVSTALSALGVSSARGATTFSQALIKMEKSVSTGDKYLDDFAKVAGLTSEQFVQAWNKDPTSVFQRFIIGLGQLDEAGLSSIEALQETGIATIRLTDTLLRTASAADTVESAIADANAAWSSGTEMTEVANERYETTAIKVANLKNNFTNLKATIGQDLTPTFQMFLDAGNGLINWFDGLDASTRGVIETIAGIVAAIGPVLIALGLITTGIGRGITVIGNLVGVIGKVVTAVGASTLGWVALAAAVVAGTVAFVDWVSGAKAARDAANELTDAVEDLREHGIDNIFKDVGDDPLKAFGLSAEEFANASQTSNEWLDGLVEVWTDGAKETDEIVKKWSDSFADDSDEIRSLIEQRQGNLENVGMLTPEAKQKLEEDTKQLDDWDTEVAALLKKRQNGFLTEDEKARLGEILTLRVQLKAEYGGFEGGYEEIHSQIERDIHAYQAANESIDYTRLGEGFAAMAQGHNAVRDAIKQEYDQRYAEIMQIEDQTEREAALAELDSWLYQQNIQAAEDYKNSLLALGKTTSEQLDFSDTTAGVSDLASTLSTAVQDGELTGEEISSITEAVQNLDVGELETMVTLVKQMQAAGATDTEIAESLGFDDTASLQTFLSYLDQIDQVSQKYADSGLEGLSTLFSEVLPEDIQQILVGLDMTQAEEDWTGYWSDKETRSVDVTADIEMSDTASQVLRDFETNNSVKIKGSVEKIGFKLGENWQEELYSLWNKGVLSAYDENGLPVPITPELIDGVDVDDLLGVDEDGFYHLIIVPEIGTEQGVDYTQSKLDTTGLEGTIFGGIDSSAQEKIDSIVSLTARINELKQAQKELDAANPGERVGILEKYGIDDPARISDDIALMSDNVTTLMSAFANGPENVDNVTTQIANLLGVLSSGDLDPTEYALYKSMLDTLLDFTKAAESGDFGSDGANIAKGIGEGLADYDGFDNYASTTVGKIETAIRNSAGIASPAAAFNPDGEYIAAGVGEGMTQYSFGADASSTVGHLHAAIATAVVGRYSAMQSLGKYLAAGVKSGIEQGTSGIVTAMVKAIEKAIAEAKKKADINSPSRVMRDEVGEMMMAGMGVGIERGARDVARTMANATRYTMDAAGSYVGTTNDNRRTYNQQSSVTVNIEGVNVNDQNDIRSLAIEIAGLTRRRNQTRGVLA